MGEGEERSIEKRIEELELQKRKGGGGIERESSSSHLTSITATAL